MSNQLVNFSQSDLTSTRKSLRRAVPKYVSVVQERSYVGGR